MSGDHRRAIRFLRRVRNLIRKGWTKGMYASDSDGQYIPYWESGACRFCLMGAILRAKMELGSSIRNDDLVMARESIRSNEPLVFGPKSYEFSEMAVKWNDSDGIKKSDIDSVLAKSIRHLEENLD